MQKESHVRPPAVVDSAAHPMAVAARAAAAQREAKEAFQVRPRFLPRFACILLAAVTHPLLDWCTSYGTELLSPFSRERFALDAIPIIDPAFTLLLVVTLVTCWLLRRRAVGCAGRSAGLHTRDAGKATDGARVHAEDGVHTLPPRHAGAPVATALVAIVGLLLSCSYIAAGKLLHDRVVNSARESLALADSPAKRPATIPVSSAADTHGLQATRATQPRGADSSPAVVPTPLSVEAYPAIGSIFVWRVVARRGPAEGGQAGGLWLVARVRPWYEPGRIERLWHRAPDMTNRWTRQAAELPEAREYAHFARGQVRTAYSYSAKDKKNVVEFHDMRYAWPTDGTDSLWPLRVTYDAAGKLLEARKDRRPRAEDSWQMVREAWADLWRP